MYSPLGRCRCTIHIGASKRLLRARMKTHMIPTIFRNSYGRTSIFTMRFRVVLQKTALNCDITICTLTFHRKLSVHTNFICPLSLTYLPRVPSALRLKLLHPFLLYFYPCTRLASEPPNRRSDCIAAAKCILPSCLWFLCSAITSNTHAMFKGETKVPPVRVYGQAHFTLY